MVEGVSFHEEMWKAFQFHGLWKYAKEQKEHHFEEERMYYKVYHYYTTHYFKILDVAAAGKYNLIPSSWMKYSAAMVDIGTKRNAIKELFGKWIEWEKETKKLYDEMYLELTNLREIAAAIYIEKLIEDVDAELKQVQKDVLNLEAIGYDMTLIIDWQVKDR